jgi:acetyltransferase-like isoleucine patch superfamily enzyme
MKYRPEIRKVQIRDVTFGENVTVIEPVNIYECEIGNDCFIGPFVEIQRNVKIGNNCRIQSHAFICELVEIGEFCFISHGVKFVNDLFSAGKPAGGDRSLWRPTKVGSYTLIGTNATILPVTITDHVVIGAGSVVTKDIHEPGVYAGNPARKLRSL